MSAERRRRSPGAALTAWSVRRPRAVLWVVYLIVLTTGLGMVRIKVDTDPENMLPADHPVRVENAALADEFGAGPVVVVGLFGDVDEPAVLDAVVDLHHELVERPDVLAESTISVASVLESAGIGRPVATQAAADAIVGRVEAHPLLARNVVFAEHQGAALFVGLSHKDAASEVATAARRAVSEDPRLGGHEVVIAGQPLAEDAFGSQMFIQMGVFAPLAGFLVFAILLAFFRRLAIVVPAMLLALSTVIVTMGALIGSGNTLHIMSSMIPIFLMPVAILDSVHVVSEFSDRMSRTGGDRTAMLVETLDELARPLGYTTLTTAVGFGSLALVPIPPVRVFGAFVAFGVVLAWILTHTFLPACLLVARPGRHRMTAPSSNNLGRAVARRRTTILTLAAVLGLAALPAVATAEVNDHPVRWFRSSHDVRAESERLGQALPGMFTSYLVVNQLTDGALDDGENRAALEAVVTRLRAHPEVGAVQSYLDGSVPRSASTAIIRLQQRNGDNVATQGVIADVDAVLANAPLTGLEVQWAGEAYLNLVWQQEMVRGMLIGFATTLAVITVLLTALFRSVKWAALAMVPVLWTVLLVYGGLSAMGRDFDMPVAVLSTMVLGIGVDFAIHFVERYRSLLAETGSAGEAIDRFFGDPATALTRNAVVIGVGFSPLLLSSLVPYVVVGTLLASIIGLSWLSTVTILPAVLSGPPTQPAGDPRHLPQSEQRPQVGLSAG